MTFGRSPDATCGTFVAPVSSKFNGESNAHTHLVCRRRESSKNRDFSRNGKIFLKSRTCPGLGLKGLRNCMPVLLKNLLILHRRYVFNQWRKKWKVLISFQWMSVLTGRLVGMISVSERTYHVCNYIKQVKQALVRVIVLLLFASCKAVHFMCGLVFQEDHVFSCEERILNILL